MHKERKMLNELLDIFESYYKNTSDDDTWSELANKLPEINGKYKTELWQDMCLAMVNHLERKRRFENGNKQS